MHKMSVELPSSRVEQAGARRADQFVSAERSQMCRSGRGVVVVVGVEIQLLPDDLRPRGT